MTWGLFSLEGKNTSQVCGEDFAPVSPSVVLILPSIIESFNPPIIPCHHGFLSINELDVKKKNFDLLVCDFNSALKFRVCPRTTQP